MSDSDAIYGTPVKEEITTEKIKTIDNIKRNDNDLAQELYKIQKEIKKSRANTLLVIEMSILAVAFLLIMTSGVTNALIDITPKHTMKTRYFTENLKGDTVDTWKSWRLVGSTLSVNILKSPGVTEHQIDVIKNSIVSEKTVEVDDLTVNKGLNSKSTYFEGWVGALKSISDKQTKYRLPTNFNFVDTPGGEGNIIISLSNLKDTDGYTGYTKSVTEGSEILKVFIVIYDISNVSDRQLSAIIRHEFGHALGLGHSTAPEDLMAPTINMIAPYISECNVDAIVDLYNANEGSSTVCKK